MENPGKKSSETDIDYQYPDEQLNDNASDFDLQGGGAQPPQKRSGLLSRFSKKQIIMFILVMIVLFAVFQILTQKEKAATEVPESKIAPEKKPTVVKTVQKKEVTTTKQPSINLVPPASQLGGDELTQIQAQFQSMSKEVSDLKEAMSNLVGAIEVLATQVQELRSAQQLSPSTFVPFKPKVVYYLKAVVPGRAWLESNDGNLITVKEGDALRGYGTINKIDANEGWVQTSSGLVIKYGKNDS